MSGDRKNLIYCGLATGMLLNFTARAQQLPAGNLATGNNHIVVLAADGRLHTYSYTNASIILVTK